MIIKKYLNLILIFISLIPFLFNGQVSAMGKKLLEGEGRHKMVIIPEGLTDKEIPEPENKGGKLFITYCSQCHNLPNPAMYSSDEWQIVFDRMVGHATIIGGAMKGIILPSPGAKEDIITYLQRNGLKALPKDSPALKDIGAFQFLWFCSTCHAIPDPASHTSEEWKGVVKRMNNNRKHWGRPEMTSGEMEEILKFLAKEGPKKD